MSRSLKILIFENSFRDLKKSRFPLGEYLEKKGIVVEYACPNPKEKFVTNILLAKSLVEFLRVFIALLDLSRLENRKKINVVLSFRLLPNIVSYLCSFLNVKNKRILVITGLGISFSGAYRWYFHRNLISYFYRCASKRCIVVTQNLDDKLDLGLPNAVVISGSGFKVRDWQKKKDRNKVPRLLYSGRLLKSKGIVDVVEIFRHIRLINKEATLTIAGDVDLNNPDSLTKYELDILKNEEGVSVLGWVDDIDTVYKEANIMIYLSRYREGVPRALIESLAYGLTIITTDSPGCKEIVANNGLCLSANESIDVAVNYISTMSENSLESNSLNSIELFAEKFSDRVVYSQFLELVKWNEK